MDGKGLDAKLIAILAAIGVAVAALGFGAGYLTAARATQGVETQLAEMRSEMTKQGDAAETQREKAVSKAVKQCEATKARLATYKTRAAKLDARRELGRVLLALDDRNFGIAQKHLAASIDHLEESGESEELAPLVESLQKAQVTVAGNLNQQRTAFRGHVDQLDGVIDAAR